jgi:hypothetical protein
MSLSALCQPTQRCTAPLILHLLLMLQALNPPLEMLILLALLALLVLHPLQQ